MVSVSMCASGLGARVLILLTFFMLAVAAATAAAAIETVWLLAAARSVKGIMVVMLTERKWFSTISAEHFSDLNDLAHFTMNSKVCRTSCDSYLYGEKKNELLIGKSHRKKRERRVARFCLYILHIQNVVDGHAVQGWICSGSIDDSIKCTMKSQNIIS